MLTLPPHSYLVIGLQTALASTIPGELLKQFCCQEFIRRCRDNGNQQQINLLMLIAYNGYTARA